MHQAFLQRTLPHVNRPVHRLGLSATFGLDERGIQAAFERGLNYVFWNPYAFRLTKVLASLPAAQRDALVVATGPTLGFTAGAVRRRVERALSVLRRDCLDVVQLYWLGKTSAWRQAVVEELQRLKDEGKVRAMGVSIHDRKRAGQLAADSPLDLFMVRYNAAHPGAEQDVFPHLDRRHPAVVAYTATAWRRLLKRPRGWDGPVPTAGDCYRFCLSNPQVDVVLCGPANLQQLEDDLHAVEQGALSEEQMQQMRAFGRKVHG